MSTRHPTSPAAGAAPTLPPILMIRTIRVPARRSPPDVDEVAEFDTLLNALDLGVINRKGWDRLKDLIARAIVEACDAETGLQGYLRILAKWQSCPAYDGRS